MNPARVLFHPLTFSAALLSIAGVLLPKQLQLGDFAVWSIGLGLALLPLLTAQISAVYGDVAVPVSEDHFHLWIVAMTTVATVIQTVQTFLATAPPGVHVPAVVVGVFAVLYGVCNAAVNQLHLADPGTTNPSAGAA